MEWFRLMYFQVVERDFWMAKPYPGGAIFKEIVQYLFKQGFCFYMEMYEPFIWKNAQT